MVNFNQKIQKIFKKSKKILHSLLCEETSLFLVDLQLQLHTHSRIENDYLF